MQETSMSLEPEDGCCSGAEVTVEARWGATAQQAGVYGHQMKDDLLDRFKHSDHLCKIGLNWLYILYFFNFWVFVCFSGQSY